MRILLYANGYARPFKNDNDELRCGVDGILGGDPNCKPHPSSVDFKTLAKKSGGPSFPILTISQLVDFIKKQPKGSIQELRMLGHASSWCYAFGGTMTKYTLTFYEPSNIARSRTFKTAIPKLRALRDRFTENGLVTLAGCNTGVGVHQSLLEFVSRAFLVCSAGFKGEIGFARGGRATGPLVRTKDGKWRHKIANRDGVDPKTRGQVRYPNIGPYHKNAWLLRPDAKSYAGQLLLNSLFKVAGRTSAGGARAKFAAIQVGYQMIKIFHSKFFPTEQAPSVPGIGYEQDLSGLRVDFDKTINVGKQYAQSITLMTIGKRAAEMGKALNHLARGKPGIVPMT